MRFYFVLIVYILSSVTVFSQSAKALVLKPGKGKYIPRLFFVSTVSDERADTTFFATLNKSGKTERLNFQSGVANAMKAYAVLGSKVNEGKQSVSMQLKNVDINGRKNGSAWYVTSNITIAFSVGKQHLVDYTAKGSATLYEDPGQHIEDFLKQAIDADLKAFDEWWAGNKGSVATRDEVKVNVVLSKTSDQANFIVYDINRPLQIIDFTGPVVGAVQEMAATMSGVSMRYSTLTQNSQVEVNVIISAFFDKSKSWFRPEGKNERILAHEQLHFDISAIKACELVTRIKQGKYTQGDFAALLDQMHKAIAKESEEEEILYDTETNHGIIKPKQEEWSVKLKQQLKNAGCF